MPKIKVVLGPGFRDLLLDLQAYSYTIVDAPTHSPFEKTKGDAPAREKFDLDLTATEVFPDVPKLEDKR